MKKIQTLDCFSYAHFSTTPTMLQRFQSRRFPSIRWRSTKSQLEKTEGNVYKINELVEKPPRDKAPSNLAIMGRYILTPDIFDKIDETEAGVGGEIQLTDALQKLDSIYGVAFEGRIYDIGNRLEWVKTSIEFALDGDESGDDLVSYMKSYI